MKESYEYTNGELTIIWKPKLCAHSGICVHTLPQVYRPKESPWIVMGNTPTESLIAQIEKCPSGALSYKLNK